MHKILYAFAEDVFFLDAREIGMAFIDQDTDAFSVGHTDGIFKGIAEVLEIMCKHFNGIHSFLRSGK